MIRRSLFAVMATVLSVGLIAQGASAAGTPVKQEVLSQLKTIQANPEFKSLKKFSVKTPADAQKAIPKLQALQSLYSSAGTAVAASTATTSAQRSGRSDWVSAVKTNVKGIGDLISGLKQFIAGKKSAAQNDIDKGAKLDLTANQQSLKAYKLLGIKVS